MTTTTPNPSIHQYEYPSAHRVGLATTETALGLPDALAEAVSAPAPYTEAYPRLQWQRTAEADAVRYGKLCIHDKVSPAEFIATLLKDRETAAAQQANWFHDFNNLPPNAHFEPYRHHAGNWNNRLIKSSGQRAMASLLQNEGMAGQVDLIYMDPPYNINFRSNFQGLVDDTNSGDRWEDIPLDIRSVKAFRDSYRNGVHTYLDQLRTQLLHGRDLLKESGSFVMQIGPDNLHYVAVLMGEVFGPENHVATVPYRTGNTQGEFLGRIGNWLVWYAKDIKHTKYRQLHSEIKDLADAIDIMGSAAQYESPDGSRRGLRKAERENPALLPKEGRLFRAYPLVSEHESPTRSETFYRHATGKPCEPHQNAWDDHQCTASCNIGSTQLLCPVGKKCGPQCDANAYPCPTGKHWTVSLSGLQSIADQGRLYGNRYLQWIRYSDELAGRPLDSFWNDGGIVLDSPYIVETPPRVLERILLMTTDPGDLVLDPTCGSGAMPLMAERWGRRWIAVDTAAVSIAVARQRIATAVHPYWLLQDSPEGQRREYDLDQELLPADRRVAFAPPAAPDYRSDPAQGFVLARQQRVSAATLAYGPGPDDIIRHPDRPEVDGSKRRVSSGFTVESDLPFTVVSPDAPAPPADDAPGGVNAGAADEYSTAAIVRSLATAGIRMPGAVGLPAHTYAVHDITPTVEIAGVTHTGVVTDAGGVARPALFYICQPDELAGQFQTQSLTRVARLRADRYAVIISYGREGDFHSFQEAQGSLIVLHVNANRDHMIPGLDVKRDDNALVVISEPDLTIHHEDDGRISLSANALTVYNPATGQVETQDNRNIVAIMTDTDYDTASFRCRLWNLPQQGSTSERRLRQIRDAFRSDLDEAKWQRMRSHRTLPFAAPAGRTVAVKVVDHTGMEHMKVLTL